MSEEKDKETLLSMMVGNDGSRRNINTSSRIAMSRTPERSPFKAFERKNLS